jgi:hypothetical protein
MTPQEAAVFDRLSDELTPWEDQPPATIAPEVTMTDPPASGGYPTGGRRRVTLTSAADVKVRPVRWLWHHRIALGTLALLVGKEGVGKSTFAYQLVADITRGRLAGAFYGTPRTVVISATEDSREHTIVPRLMAADADLALVHFVDVVTSEDTAGALMLPKDNRQVEDVCRQVQPALLLLDPFISRPRVISATSW